MKQSLRLRLWLFQDKGDQRLNAMTPDLAISFHAKRTTFDLTNIHLLAPSHGTLFTSENPTEIFLPAPILGPFHKLTVFYAQVGSVKLHAPNWPLTHIVVRTDDGTCSLFAPKSPVLQPGTATHLLFQRSWYEDQYGNCSPQPPISKEYHDFPTVLQSDVDDPNARSCSKQSQIFSTDSQDIPIVLQSDVDNPNALLEKVPLVDVALSLVRKGGELGSTMHAWDLASKRVESGMKKLESNR